MPDSASKNITKWPAPLDEPVLFVGGTFDPPHLGHTDPARRVRDQVCPEAWLIYVPAARSPHKKSKPGATDQQRLKMLALAIEDLGRAAIWTDEIDRSQNGEPSYWIDSLRRASQIRTPHPLDRMFIGADQAAAFTKWKEHHEIERLAEPLTVLRPPVETEEAFFETVDQSIWKNRLVSVGPLEISSTQIRAGEMSGLPPKVARYISDHHLYASG